MPNINEAIQKKFNWKEQLEVINPEITQNRATGLSNNPERMNAEEIKAFSQVLDIPVHILIQEYNCGKEKLLLSEAEMLISESENQSKITHAI